MTLTHQLAAILSLPPTGGQVGYLLSVLVAFVLGWLAKAAGDKRRLIRWRRAWGRGEQLGKK